MSHPRRQRGPAVGVLVLLACASADRARGQAPVAGAAAAEPSTHLQLDLDATWFRPNDALHGAAWSSRAGGALAPHPQLELGARLGVRGWHLASRNAAREAGRFGMTPVGLWVGTGLRVDGMGLGTRLLGAVGPSTLGLDALDPDAPHGALRLRIDATHEGAFHEARIGADAGMLWHGPGTWLGGVDATVAAGPRRWTVRPLLGLQTRFVERARPAIRGRLGAWIRVTRRWRLDASSTFAGPHDPAGARVGLRLRLLWWPGAW